MMRKFYFSCSYSPLLSKPSRKQKRRKRFIHCSLKVSFRGWKNSQKNKTSTKLSHFSQEVFCTLYTLCKLHKLLIFDVVQPAGPFLRPNVLWYAQNSQWVQNLTFPNRKLIFFEFIFVDE